MRYKRETKTNYTEILFIVINISLLSMITLVPLSGLVFSIAVTKVLVLVLGASFLTSFMLIIALG